MSQQTPYFQMCAANWMALTPTGKEFHPSPQNFEKLYEAFMRFKVKSISVENLVYVAEKMQREGTWLYVTKTAHSAQERMRAEQAEYDETSRQRRIQQAIHEDSKARQQEAAPPRLSPEEEFEQRKQAAFAEFERPLSQTEPGLARLQRVSAMKEKWMRDNLPPLPAPANVAHPDTLRRTRAELQARRDRADRQRDERGAGVRTVETSAPRPQILQAPREPGI
jgi:hypothetical protein